MWVAAVANAVASVFFFLSTDESRLRRLNTKLNVVKLRYQTVLAELIMEKSKAKQRPLAAEALKLRSQIRAIEAEIELIRSR